MIRTIKTSTELLPILCPDLYESAISPSHVFMWEMDELANELPEEINPYDMAIDLDKYLCRLVGYANEVIERDVLPELREYGVTNIIATYFEHPDYYRLWSGRADIIDWTVEVDDSFFSRMETELRAFCADEEAQAYCREHWSDYPGFWSYMPDTVEKIIEGWDYFSEVRQQSAYLSLICNKLGLLWRDDRTDEDGPAQAHWEEKIMENLLFEDFISDEDYNLIAANRQEA